MATFKLSRCAEEDLLNIADYTLERWGREQASRYLAEMESCCQRIAAHPQLGRSCHHIRPDLRRMEQGKHIIFYRALGESVLITRVLHQSMLPTRHSMDEDASL
ncbi:MAG: type II toxin-antitoxin system RelE/ParE family toxin [Acidobacteriaceae bacterium]|nr:type II toxin-antitoxin system RelE/ParE family toxin [Acidobacteriaceae bacterium]